MFVEQEHVKKLKMFFNIFKYVLKINFTSSILFLIILHLCIIIFLK